MFFFAFFWPGRVDPGFSISYVELFLDESRRNVP